MLSRANVLGRDQLDYGKANALKCTADGLKQWHERAQCENAQGR